MKILVVGTVCNVSRQLERDLKRVSRGLKSYAEIHYDLVESDSEDTTISLLQEKVSIDPKFRFISLGSLRNKIPNRIERIRYCRNVYIQEIRNTFEEQHWDYVVVADLDGMNRALTKKCIKSTFASDVQWDAAFANQSFGYYDLYALRAETWLEEDCFVTLERMKIQKLKVESNRKGFGKFIADFKHFDALRVAAIYGKMLVIDRNEEWIPVKSAFGGLGIYKTQLFLQHNYDFLDLEIGIYSEHIDFHQKCTSNGFKLYINPALINSRVNEYNLNRIKVVRFIRELLKRYPIIRWN